MPREKSNLKVLHFNKKDSRFGKIIRNIYRKTNISILYIDTDKFNR